MRAEAVKIYRFLDAKPAIAMKNMLQKIMSVELTKEDTSEYVTWLKTHSKNLIKRENYNFFYDFEGAPIWKYGIHCIIFDKKHIVIPFLSSATIRRAVFIRDCPKIAAELAGSLDFLRDNFFRNGEPERRLMDNTNLEALASLPSQTGKSARKS